MLNPRLAHRWIAACALLLGLLSACSDQPRFGAIDVSGADYARTLR